MAAYAKDVNGRAGAPASGVGGSSYTDSMNAGDVEPVSAASPL
jgi:hypothetical protein